MLKLLCVPNVCGKETEIEAKEDSRRPSPRTRQSDAKCAGVRTPADLSPSVDLRMCDYFAEERHSRESRVAPAVVMLARTHTQIEEMKVVGK